MIKLRVLLVVALVAVGGFLFTAAPADAGAISPGVWYEFRFDGSGGAFATGCTAATCVPSSGTPTTFLDAPPWTFTAPAAGAMLTVTDAFARIDRFEIFDGGGSIGSTSAPVGPGSCGSDPVPCLADAGTSSGVFHLGAGGHSITIKHLTGATGAGYLRWDEKRDSVPTPAALGLMALGLAAAALRRRGS